MAGGEGFGDQGGEVGLACLVMGPPQQVHHAAAGLLAGQGVAA